MREKKNIVFILLLVLVVVGIVYFLLQNKKNENLDVATATTNAFEADIYLYTREEGGRSTPIYENFHPQVVFENKEIYLNTLKLPKEFLKPGESGHVTIILQKETSMNIEDEFILQEGGRKIGKGTITKLLESTK